jgi:beta-phosphoglucomutase-like phosphatase (HAD superfamily)
MRALISRLTRFARLFSARVVIFDFDGVLVDGERFHYQSYNAVFQVWPHHRREGVRQVLDVARTGTQGANRTPSLEHRPAGDSAREAAHLLQYCRNGTIRFFPEARELVQLLCGAGKTLAIASGTMKSDIDAILENEGLLESFASVVGSDTAALKPDPESFIKVLRDVDAAPGEAVVIEDAEKGVGAAIAAKIPVVVVRTPEMRAIEFEGADLVLESHAELIEFARRVFS